MRQGEDLYSIAVARGHAADTIWEHGANTEVRETRRDPRALLPGDRLVVPAIERKVEELAIDTKYRFKVTNIPIYLRLRFVDEDAEPRAAVPYVIEFPKGIVREGRLDDDGRLEEVIDPSWKRATLWLGYSHNEDDELEEDEEDDDDDDVLLLAELLDDEDDEDDDDLHPYDVLELDLGNLDPADTVTGVQGRLSTLGYEPGRIDGDVGDFTRAAILRFQREHGLDETGEPDDTVQTKLDSLYQET